METFCFCGHVIVPTGLPLKRLAPIMSERAKWGKEITNLLMWEDKCLGDCRNLDDLDKPLDQILNELADGVVIIFQV